MTQRKRLAILVGGGPAPGINSVIGAATIRAALEGVEVLGIENGFEWIMQGNLDHVRPLTIENVSRIHFRGGSFIGISRANPTDLPEHLENAVTSLVRLNVSDLITIGGDDTAYSAMKLEEKGAGRIRVVHVPKSIDNDLDLPPHADTFGFQTARHLGVEILKHAVLERLRELDLSTTIVAKNIGYELRCADPIPYDMEYTRDLGYCAAKCLLGGGNAVMISMLAGQFEAIPFDRLLDPQTGRAKVRMVDIHSTRYSIARRYMIRIRRDDFDDPRELAKFAATAGLSVQEFRAQFEYLIENEPPPLELREPEPHEYELVSELGADPERGTDLPRH